jgi:SAM-dependent methyltransferase
VIDWPALPSGEDVVWDGKAFRTRAGSTRVLSCSADLTGWDDELTELHEIEAGLGTHPIDRASRRNAIDMLRAMDVRTDGAFLEVGCSSGYLLQDLLGAFPGAEIVGADTIKRSLERVGEMLPGMPLLKMDLLSCPLPGGQFDAIVALNVLEHIEEDARALSQIARLLKPGGVFVVEVPQGPGLFDSYDALLRHVRRYSRAELLAKVRGAGLNVETVTSLGFVPYPLFWAVKKISRLRYGVRGERSKDRESNVRAQIRSTSRNVLLDAAFAVETHVRPLGRFLPGIRCAAAARKPRS